jgi:hypothetical protein
LARCDLSSPRSVEQNVHTTFSFPNPLSESEELQSWGCSKILLSFLDAIRRSFLTKSTTAAMLTSVRVDFGRTPLSSSETSSVTTRSTLSKINKRNSVCERMLIDSTYVVGWPIDRPSSIIKKKISPKTVYTLS